MHSRSHPSPLAIAGIDFTSRPTRTKPITVALGRCEQGVARLERIETHAQGPTRGLLLSRHE